MKTIILSKKPVLNKITISNLNSKEMKNAIGGESAADTTCLVTQMITCGQTSCDTFCLSIPNGPCYIYPCQ